MSRSSYEANTFSRMVSIKDREGDFYLVRKGEKNSRVVSVDQKATAGEVVATNLIYNERKLTPDPVTADATPNPENSSVPPAEGETVIQDNTVQGEIDVEALLGQSAVLLNPDSVQEQAPELVSA